MEISMGSQAGKPIVQHTVQTVEAGPNVKYFGQIFVQFNIYR